MDLVSVVGKFSDICGVWERKVQDLAAKLSSYDVDEGFMINEAGLSVCIDIDYQTVWESEWGIHVRVVQGRPCDDKTVCAPTLAYRRGCGQEQILVNSILRSMQDGVCPNCKELVFKNHQYVEYNEMMAEIYPEVDQSAGRCSQCRC